MSILSLSESFRSILVSLYLYQCCYCFFIVREVLYSVTLVFSKPLCGNNPTQTQILLALSFCCHYIKIICYIQSIYLYFRTFYFYPLSHPHSFILNSHNAFTCPHHGVEVPYVFATYSYYILLLSVFNL